MKKTEQRVMILLFLLPALLLIVTFTFVPAIRAFAYAFTRWNGLASPQWIGLDNFKEMFLEEGGGLFKALGHNVFIMIVPSIFVLILALFFATMIHRGVKGARIFRIAYFFPNVMGMVAIAFMWMLIYYSTDMGILNTIARWLGFKSKTWLDSSILLWSLVPVMVWQSAGWFMLLFLAAMQGVPESLYDAARIDGAGKWKMFWNVTFPLIWDVITIGMIFLIMGGLKFFEMIWLWEHQTAKPETMTIAVLLYQRAFIEYRFGYGTAVGVVLFLLVLCVTIFSFRVMRRKEALEY